MWNVLRERVLGANGASINGGGLSSFGESVVARVKVFALFEVLGKVVGLGRELAIEAEEALFVGRKSLRPH